MKYIKTYEENIDKSKITELDLSSKGLTELPDLSEYINLKYLYCDNNNLTSLPELPKSLKELHCYGNNLPYDNLDEYREWKKDPITWEMNKTASKYNI